MADEMLRIFAGIVFGIGVGWLTARTTEKQRWMIFSVSVGIMGALLLAGCVEDKAWPLDSSCMRTQPECRLG